MKSQSFAALRQGQFARLDKDEHVYLDYTGSGLYPESSVQQHLELLETSLLGNPHSANPTSQAATELVEQTRSKVLSFVNADPNTHDVIFTANASAAIKLVGESYPFRRSSTFAALADNHNSVIGIREFARKAGATTLRFPLDDELRATPDISSRLRRGGRTRADKLFAYPAQSNFSGVKHSLDLVKTAKGLGYDVFLDASAFVPTNRLDLSVVEADFVCMSFYKIFGFPTGVGALIARKQALRKLNRPWFAGGTIKYVSFQTSIYELEEGHAAFEDGSVNFLGIPAVSTGLKFIEDIGVERITNHVTVITEQLLTGLLSLKYSTGERMVKIYGPKTMKDRGGTINFDVLRPSGVKVHPLKVEKAANGRNISLRTGCFCNPGASEKAYAMDKSKAAWCFLKYKASKESFSVEKFSQCMGEVYLGSIRVSVGVASSSQDIQTFIAFVEDFCDGLRDDFIAESSKILSIEKGVERKEKKASPIMVCFTRQET